jgi:hypothetical protein
MNPLSLSQFNALLTQPTSSLRLTDLTQIQGFLPARYVDFGPPGNSPTLGTVAATFKS